MIRTGSTTDGSWQRYTGQSDLPLSAKGAEMLRELRGRFEYPRADMVCTSPLQRCVQTAELLYPETYTVETPGFADMDLGDFSGQTLEELRGREDFEAWLQNSYENPPPGGEHVEDFTRRILLSLQDVFQNLMQQRMMSAAVITHAGVIMTLLSAAGLPRLPLHEWKVENGCGYTLLMTPQMWMRDRSFEVHSRVPWEKDAAGEDDPV